MKYKISIEWRESVVFLTFSKTEKPPASLIKTKRENTNYLYQEYKGRHQYK